MFTKQSSNPDEMVETISRYTGLKPLSLRHQAAEELILAAKFEKSDDPRIREYAKGLRSRAKAKFEKSL